MRRIALTLAVLILAGCQTTGLMQVPNLYRQGEANPFASLAPERQTNPIPVLYATDREPLQRDGATLDYGHARSPSLAVGVAQVNFGSGATWDDLVQASLQENRSTSLIPRAGQYQELARYPESFAYQRAITGSADGRARLDSAVSAADAELHKAIHQQMSGARTRSVYLYVHGYNVHFGESIETIAQLWHFLGRDGICMAYSWPAGHGGIRGYTIDRESSEFTIAHLKRFIESVARSDDVDRINIISHSRGADVTLSALRELYLQHQCNGQTLKSHLKLGDIILAAPDIDVAVMNQRVAAEGLVTALDRLTIYVSEKDRAIGLAAWLFKSALRLGSLPIDLLTPDQQEYINEIPALEIIDARTRRTDLIGHSYFYQSPAVSSDVILLLSTGAAPGSLQRPLERISHNIWAIHDGYPYPEQPPK